MSQINNIQSSNIQSTNTQLNNRINRANFNQLFQEAIRTEPQELKFSGHAEKRMVERNIQLDNDDIRKISDSIDRASDKGANDALILYKDIVMIASIRNKTIITAMDQNNINEDIITNVDSAIFVK